MKFNFTGVGITLVCLMLSSSVWAWELNGEKNIFLINQAGEKIQIGSVLFQPNGQETSFDIHWNHAKMKDYFLSMREFKCLDGKTEVQCQVPYPYKSPKTISTRSYDWLEHYMLFLYKSPENFGAKMWNGIYYKLALTEEGLKGTPYAVDLNAIAAPPDHFDMPPFGNEDRSLIPEGARWFKQLLIE